MHIDELFAQAKTYADDKNVSMSLPNTWGQGRTAFGGVSAGLLYTAIKTQISDDRPLRSLSTNFVGPLIFDTPFSFQVDILREGKNATQAIGKIIQNEQVVVMQQACFGVGRDSGVVVESHSTHTMPATESLHILPFTQNVTPNFIQHVDLAACGGQAPFTASKDSHLHGYMRFKEAPTEINDAHLICLIDTWPPAVMQMFKQLAPASTMTWNLEFIHPHNPVAPTDFFAYQAETRQAADGYAHTEANIWDAQGELVAISRQCVAVFD